MVRMAHASSMPGPQVVLLHHGRALYWRQCSKPGNKYMFNRQKRLNEEQARKSTLASATSSNLGALQSLVDVDPAASQSFPLMDTEALQLTMGPRIDGGAAFASILLLLLLLALSSNRILGLERFFVQWVREMGTQKRYRERNQIISTREQLERQFGTEGGDGGSGSSGSGDGGGGRDGPQRSS